MGEADSTDLSSGETVVNTSDSQVTRANVRCPLCAHDFQPGKIHGNLFCAKCGRRFNPWATTEETVAILPNALKQEGGGEPLATMAKRLDLDHRDNRNPHMDSGRRFGDYDIISEVARGGMGIVYRARQRNLKRIVALKVLRGGDGATDEDLLRFLREAKAAASLTHPNIVPIHELNVHEEQPFFTMDYVEGSGMDAVIASGTLAPNQACEFIETIAHAIHYAHGQGIIHRDLKPANIIVDRAGNPMITDFGLAVNLTSDVDSQRMTRTGSVMGTIPYIPPEQAGGRVAAIDARSDVYSLGAVLYEMLTGRPPFQGETQFELLRRVIHNDPVPPCKLNSRIHPDVETICLKCLEKDPRRRYQTAAALAEDCRAFLNGEVILARPATLVYRFRRFLARRRVPSILISCIVILALALFVNHFSVRKSEKRHKKELTKAKIEKAEIQKEVDEKNNELRRYWRQEFVCDFNTPPEKSLIRINSKKASRDAAAGVLRIHGWSREVKPSPVFLIRQSFSGDFRLQFRLYVPAENAGGFSLIMTNNRWFRRSDTARVLRIGVPGNPGCTITQGEAPLVDDAKFELLPEAWHRVEIIRADGTLQTRIDDKIVLAEKLATASGQSGRTFLGMWAEEGEVQIDDVTVSVQGLSRANITGLLEIARSLEQNGDPYFANKLYARVVREGSKLHTHLVALRGFARTLAIGQGRRARGLTRLCDKFIAALKITGRLEPGEAAFLRGLAFSELRIPKEKRLALAFFDQAEKEALQSVKAVEGEEPSPPLTPYGLLAKLEKGILFLRLKKFARARQHFASIQKDGTLQRLTEDPLVEALGADTLRRLLAYFDFLINRPGNIETPERLLETARTLFPNGGQDLALRFHRLAERQIQKKQFAAAKVSYAQAMAMAPSWYLPHVELAQLFFRMGKSAAGIAVLDAASKKLPDSFKLHLAIAQFYLRANPPESYRPDLAEVAAKQAVELSEKKNPQAWEYYARALFLADLPQQAYVAITEALTREETPERLKLSANIQAAIQEKQESPTTDFNFQPDRKP